MVDRKKRSQFRDSLSFSYKLPNQLDYKQEYWMDKEKRRMLCMDSGKKYVWNGKGQQFYKRSNDENGNGGKWTKKILTHHIQFKR